MKYKGYYRVCQCCLEDVDGKPLWPSKKEKLISFMELYRSDALSFANDGVRV